MKYAQGILLVSCVYIAHLCDWGVYQQDVEAESEDINIVPNPEVQQRIDKLFKDPTAFTSSTDSTVQEIAWAGAWRTLASDVGNDTLLPQLIYYGMHHSDNVVTSMAFEIGVGTLHAFDEISEGAIANALIPYISTNDPKVKRKIEGHLGYNVEKWRDGRPDYSTYRALIAAAVRRDEPLPRTLISYMYDSHPGESVLAMMIAFLRDITPDDRKSILWAEHQVSDVLWQWKYDFLPKDQVTPPAAEALTKLVDHEQWWARLYVAEVMRQHPPFRTPELIAALRDDPDESVKKTIAAIEGKDQE